MLCPICKIKLKEATLHNVGINYCSQCLGLWFEEEELRWAKDEKDKSLNWLDIDLWKDQKKFKIFSGQKLCPKCRLPLYEVNYGDSKIKVDLCNICHGIWLDRKEFKKIIEYLKERADFEVLNNYLKNLVEEAAEVFTGPETFRRRNWRFFNNFKTFKLQIRY
ncbi:unnamed protein product [marine sediment metagenome]|uniref:Transcription factor zinc-finger domain-containing protein n=1 Tax=marine sediment metagenome TaxID=412755 RepID=X1JFX8_9ZZZZ